MNTLSFLIKPASGLCNMRCGYCFYADEIAARKFGNTDIMSFDTVDILISEAFSSLGSQGRVSFAFQGGEPTLAGLSYFRYFVSKVSSINKGRIPVSYAIQTNGLTIDEEWADFFLENNFLVGISLDGEKAIHDSLRHDAAGKGTWNRIIKNLTLLQKKQVEVNLLCVVSRLCAKHPVKVYRSLQKLGVQYLQFIPCLDPIATQRGSMPYSLTPALYGDFLCALFDEWYRDFLNGTYISIRLFDDYIHLIMGLPPNTCSTAGTCGTYFVVENDGTLYPCDFYCLDQWKLGKLGDAPLTEIANGKVAQAFLRDSLNHPPECTSCSWSKLCHGGCKRDWDWEDGKAFNYYCSAFRKFFGYAAPRMVQLARNQQCGL